MSTPPRKSNPFVYLAVGILLGLVAAGVLLTIGRPYVRSLLRPEPPAPLTPVAINLPPPSGAGVRAAAIGQAPDPPTSTSTVALPADLAISRPEPAAPIATQPPAPIPASPTPIPASPAPPPPPPVIIGDRSYTALLPAAVKESQRYQYSCEFDAGWVIFQSYGFDVSVDELIDTMSHDQSIEPYIQEANGGRLIYGGDIINAFSGDYTSNFLARSTGAAFAHVFAAYGLESQPVRTRAELEAALLRGELVWMKTTVDFKPWRPATWITPGGAQIKTVLGNDHAVVVMGFNDEVVVIRDVLGPTSTGPNRPLEYEVSWDTFMAAWGAQDYDAIAVARP
ncbi:MAG: C39 family peptidase [Chloroflexales bacterium]|nr:C39 family peptidase [Chloroflexales bacterium]